MNSNIYDEIVKLDVTTRLQLAQDLLDSVASETFSPPVTAEQRVELQARLAHERNYLWALALGHRAAHGNS